jgi:NAD(P)-dependent dehydrogenase (short-subunit alcohol dehydrogenase family)
LDLGLEGKTALITGGGRGIGRGIALGLAREGVSVAIAGRNPEPETLEELRALGVPAVRIVADVSREHEVKRMVSATIAEFGHLDFYVNNAAATWHEPVTRLTSRNVNRTLDTNLKACIWACREAARHMIERGAGSILIVSSTIQFNPAYAESSYRISKIGLRAFAETLALELGPYHIRVNTLSPGVFPTKLSGGIDDVLQDPELGPALIRSVPLRRLGDPVECGDAAAFLLSDRAASYITGADLVVDGGFRLRPLVLKTEREILLMNARTQKGARGKLLEQREGDSVPFSPGSGSQDTPVL